MSKSSDQVKKQTQIETNTYLSIALQLNHSPIGRRHIPTGMCFSVLRIRQNI
jgi:hypothetical protein